MTKAPPIVAPNANLSLRLVLLRFDERGNIQSEDHAILGFEVSAKPFLPVALVDWEQDDIVAHCVHDAHAKCWIDPQGKVYREWKDFVAPLYAAWDAAHPPQRGATSWPMDQKHPSTLPRSAARDPGPSTPGGTPPGKPR